MNPESTQCSRAPASDCSTRNSTVSDFQWIVFVDEISRRVEKDGRFTLLHSVLAELFHFDRPFFAGLNERARESCLSFTFTGAHWHADGEPSVVVFSRRERIEDF
jgi:hypothetical protein